MHKEGTAMANNFMMKLLLLFFGFLPYYSAVAQISKKPDVTSSAIQPGGFKATTLLTSVINNADIALHETDDANAHSKADANNVFVDMDDAEVLTDTEEGDDNDELDIVEDFNSGDLVMSSTTDSEAGKGIKARLLRFKQTDCEKKRGHGKGKKMKEGKCHTLHKKHFQSYQFSVGEKKGKKKDKDDEEDYDDDDSSSTACRIIVYHDGKCKDAASTANEGSCEDMIDADDNDDEEKLHSRDLMGKPKGGKYKSARFLCDGVDVSSNSSSTKSVSDYYSSPYYSATSSYKHFTSKYYSATTDHSSATPLSSQPAWMANFTTLSSEDLKPFREPTTISSKTRSGEPTTTIAPDEDDKEDLEDDDKDFPDDDKEDADEKDDQDGEVAGADIQDNIPGSQATKTRKQHRSKSHKKTKGNKKHPKQTQNTTATQPAETITSA
jgi:hypothetical protein